MVGKYTKQIRNGRQEDEEGSHVDMIIKEDRKVYVGRTGADIILCTYQSYSESVGGGRVVFYSKEQTSDEGGDTGKVSKLEP